MALKNQENSDLFHLGSHQLLKGEYRTFSNGALLVTLFQDESLVKTVSTSFKEKQKNFQNQNGNNTGTGYSKRFAMALKGAPRNDLQLLANKLNLPHCKF